MKLNDLIKVLQEIKKDIGNVPVVLSSDTEGNSWGTLKEPLSFCRLQDDESGKTLGIGLYPYAEGFDDYIEALNYKGS